MNIRQCKQCGQMVDFDEPWCDHETMEESAWLDIRKRMTDAAVDVVVDELVHKTAKELGYKDEKDI